MNINGSHCRGCGQEIVWIKTVSGKSIPCDPKVIIFEEGFGRRTLVTDNGVVIARPKIGEAGREPHWATCPKASSFKTKKGA